MQIHETVLTREVVEVFEPNAHLNTQVHLVDATLGTGGHTLALVKAGAKVLGIDADGEMLKIAQQRLKEEKVDSKKYELVKGNFINLKEILNQNGYEKVNGILFDLGVSNLHLKDSERGFSFANPEADLDMRLDQSVQGVWAKDLLNALRKEQLMELFGKVLIYPEARKLVRAIIKSREDRPFDKVGDFLEVTKVVRSKSSLSQATLPFLALRIAVNSELENISQALPEAIELLEKKGKVAVITFHSKEEEIVTAIFEKAESEEKGRFLTQKPVIPEREEVFANPRSRSAKMWVFEKI